MATTDDTRGSGVSARSSRATTDTDGQDRLSVEVADDLAVSADAGVERDAVNAADLDEADETSDLGSDDVDASHLGEDDADVSHLGGDDDADTSGFTALAVDLDDDEQPSDTPLGLTSVRLPARGRRRGRPGTIF